MSLPDAETVRKRARETQLDTSNRLTIAQTAVCAYLSDRTPAELASGVLITSDVVPALKDVIWTEKQNVFDRIAKTDGYVVCVTLCEDDDADVPVPANVWDWRHFYRCVYDGFKRVVVRVE